MKVPLWEHRGTQTGDCETLVELKAEQSHLRRQARIQVADPPTVVLVTGVETACGLSHSPTWPWPWHQRHLTRALARDMAICVPVGRLAHLSWTTDAEVACVWVTAPLSHGQEYSCLLRGPQGDTPLCVSWGLLTSVPPWSWSSPMTWFQPLSAAISQEQSCPPRHPVGDTLLHVPKGRPANLDPTAILKQPCDLISSSQLWSGNDPVLTGALHL